MTREETTIGATCALNSGGPRMCVIGIEKPGDEQEHYQAWCSWIGSNGDGHTHLFPLPCLTLLPDLQG